jgi:hypothetical protein
MSKSPMMIAWAVRSSQPGPEGIGIIMIRTLAELMLTSKSFGGNDSRVAFDYSSGELPDVSICALPTSPALRSFIILN